MVLWWPLKIGPEAAQLVWWTWREEDGHEWVAEAWKARLSPVRLAFGVE